MQIQGVCRSNNTNIMPKEHRNELTQTKVKDLEYNLP